MIEEPVYKHHCTVCDYQGNFVCYDGSFDLYLCVNSIFPPIVLARHSDEEDAFISVPLKFLTSEFVKDELMLEFGSALSRIGHLPGEE